MISGQWKAPLTGLGTAVGIFGCAMIFNMGMKWVFTAPAPNSVAQGGVVWKDEGMALIPSSKKN